MDPVIRIQPQRHLLTDELSLDAVLPIILSREECWLDVASPTDDYIRELQQNLKSPINSNTFPGILSIQQRSILFSLDFNAGESTGGPQLVHCTLVGPQLVTVHDLPNVPLLDEAWASAAVSAWGTPEDGAAISTHILINSLANTLIEALDESEAEITALAELLDSLSADEFSDTRRRILIAQKDLAALRVGLEKHRVLVENACSVSNFSKIRVRFEQTAQILASALARLGELERFLANAQNSYLAQLNVELGKSTEKLSIIVLRLTILSALMLPLNFFAGLFGMNVWYPYRVEEDQTLVGFSIVVGIMSFVTILMFFLMWRLKWFL